jgi:hypothetical protein
MNHEYIAKQIHPTHRSVLIESSFKNNQNTSCIVKIFTLGLNKQEITVMMREFTIGNSNIRSTNIKKSIEDWNARLRQIIDGASFHCSCVKPTQLQYNSNIELFLIKLTNEVALKRTQVKKSRTTAKRQRA